MHVTCSFVTIVVSDLPFTNRIRHPPSISIETVPKQSHRHINFEASSEIKRTLPDQHAVVEPKRALRRLLIAPGIHFASKITGSFFGWRIGFMRSLAIRRSTSIISIGGLTAYKPEKSHSASIGVREEIPD